MIRRLSTSAAMLLALLTAVLPVALRQPQAESGPMKSLFREAGGFDTRLSTAADRDLWIRLAARTRIGHIAEPLARYRHHTGQMHMNIDAMEHDLSIIFRKSRESGYFRDEAHRHLC